jgi:hypothetical protein
MQAGDSIVLRTYVCTDGVNPDKFDEITFSGPQSVHVVRIPATTLAYNEKFRFTITQTVGVLREFPYSIIVQVMEVV